MNLLRVSSRRFSSRRWSVPLALGAFLACAPVQAQTQHATVFAGVLATQGTFYAEFTLTDGSATGNGNSQAVISGFTVSGGTLGAILPPTSGSVIGSLSGPALTLRDSDASTGGLADFAQAFTVTSATGTLTFDFALSASGVDSTPDDFSFSILNAGGVVLATTGPKGIEMINADFTSLRPAPLAYRSTGAYSPAITVTLSAAAPEPSPFASLGLGGLALGILGLRVRWRSTIQSPECRN